MDKKTTRYSLLKRARDLGDETAWSEFYEYYKNFIYYILSKNGLSEMDIDDAVQKVMLILVKKISTYSEEKGKFRSWLSVVVSRVAYREIHKSKRSDEIKNQFLGEVDDKSDSELEQIIQKEWQSYLLTIALGRIKSRYKRTAVEVFELSMRGASVDEIVELKQLKKSTVYSYNQRIKADVKVELAKLISHIGL